ncbi:hypothetical protein [Sphingobium sp.]|uniref:hypothetical protein n=1 Tax=Sphingobium sp. TaxID=1912891 RepID=UPI003B3B8EA9
MTFAGSIAANPDRAAGTDGDALPPADILQRNLSDLFGSPYPQVRERAFDELWRPNAVIYHDEGGRAGKQNVLDAAERFASRMEGLTCSPLWPVSGHNDLHILRWIAHNRGTPVASGCQIAFIVEGRIHAFYMIDD